jgi:hypothetical protein
MSLLTLLTVPTKKQSLEQRRAEAYKALVHWGGQVGGELFGPLQPGGRREFFCLDERTWVWHEEWTDKSGQRHIVTTRYDVRTNGVFKSQGTSAYQLLSAEEARNLYNAITLYYQRVMPELMRLQQQVT